VCNSAGKSVLETQEKRTVFPDKYSRRGSLQSHFWPCLGLKHRCKSMPVDWRDRRTDMQMNGCSSVVIHRPLDNNGP